MKRNLLIGATFVAVVVMLGFGQARLVRAAAQSKDAKALQVTDIIFVTVFLCFGQSNMEGFPGIEGQDKAEFKRSKVLAAVDVPKLDRKKGNWYPAVPPLCRGSTGARVRSGGQSPQTLGWSGTGL